ncbi:hypothetical protein [Nocardioides zeae]|uniref:Uncharacterized protein n=1 Tax=Nocardioides zeae TaxID=1457234 RepID=A0AAJ1X147_9ACTN|nr:hypothetical protein [Nocardioides zeae]MDQ1103804.1 hypothetical protein [Nocardioides zeae]
MMKSEHGMGNYRSETTLGTGYGSFETDANAIAWVEGHLQHESPSVERVDLYRQQGGRGTIVMRWQRSGGGPWRQAAGR